MQAETGRNKPVAPETPSFPGLGGRKEGTALVPRKS